jgi:UDP-N-acetylmuramate--alanine ligase
METKARVNIDDLREVYFVGIGGIGMSAIARYFNSRGIRVSGYDRNSTALTKNLEEEGISIHYNEDVNAIPKDADLVVYTPAIPKDQAELVYYQTHDYKVVKRSDVLELISNSSFNICVAGTHGKTTISTMIAHILRYSGFGCNAFLGGISVNYQTNFWSSNNNCLVIEADEYDRSFLKLNPDIAVISAMDADHLDIYGDEQSMQDAFVEFGNKVKPGGLLITKFGLPRAREIKAERKLTYSLQNESADVSAANIRMVEGGYVFDVRLMDTVLSNVELKIGGMHNVENMVAAIAVAHELKIDDEKIREAVKDFRGVRRRFEYVIPPVKKMEGGYIQPVLIDDYAHHPEELRPLLKSVRSLFPQRVVTVVFQPHLFSRTKDFAEGFAEVLSMADNLILLPIYPARELPMEGVDSNIILKKVENGNRQLLTKEEMLEWMKSHELNKEFGEVIVMAGAGDIDALVKDVKQIIENK